MAPLEPKRPPPTYQPLIDHLAAQGASPVTYPFAQIEALVSRLPRRDDSGRRWWRSNAAVLRRDLSVHGWAVMAVDERRGTATFVRVPSN